MTTKDEIKDWLKKNGKNYKWLASELNMSPSAVANMLSKKGVLSSRAVLIIDLLIGKKKSTMFAVVSSKIEILLSTEELLYFNSLANKAGMSVPDWIVSTLKYVGENPALLDAVVNTKQDDKKTE